MKEKLREIFELDQIQEYAEANIGSTEWIEEDGGGKRKILEIVNLFHSAHGAYIPGMVLEFFGEAGEFDLEDPYNEKNETIYEALEQLENEVNRCLNELLPSKGQFYIGYHEYDGSYCLFYEEYDEEEAKQV